MIALLLANRYVLGALSALIVLVSAYLYVDHKGYARAEREWTVRYETFRTETAMAATSERLRQYAANARAKQEADAAIAALRQSEEARAALIKETHEEALRDRNAGRECLGADSLRRINKATPGGPD